MRQRALYPPEAVGQLAIIRASRRLGFSLPEIKQVCDAMRPSAEAGERAATAARLRARLTACAEYLVVMRRVEESLGGA